MVKQLNQAILDSGNKREARLYSELESIFPLTRDNLQIKSRRAFARSASALFGPSIGHSKRLQM